MTAPHVQAAANVGLCVGDPDRWSTNPDEGARQICRACPRRWLCAQEAVETPHPEGMWAGIVIPDDSRQRAFALKKLRVLAEYGQRL